MCFSQTDTTSYPKILYPNNIVKDTCIAFTTEQAKLAAIDAINADAFKTQLDSCKHVVSEYQEFVNSKNKEIKTYKFKEVQYKNILTLERQKIDVYSAETEKLQKQVKNSIIEKKILYPVAVGLLIATVAGFLTK